MSDTDQGNQPPSGETAGDLGSQLFSRLPQTKAHEPYQMRQGSMPPGMWGGRDFITQGARNYPGLAPSPWAPQPQDVNGLVAQAGMYLNQNGSIPVQGLAASMVNYRGTHMKEYLAGREAASRMQYEEYKRAQDMLLDRQTRELQKYADIFAAFGKETTHTPEGGPGRARLGRQGQAQMGGRMAREIEQLTYEFNDPRLREVLHNQGVAAAEALLNDRNNRNIAMLQIRDQRTKAERAAGEAGGYDEQRKQWFPTEPVQPGTPPAIGAQPEQGQPAATPPAGDEPITNDNIPSTDTAPTAPTGPLNAEPGKTTEAEPTRQTAQAEPQTVGEAGGRSVPVTAGFFGTTPRPSQIWGPTPGQPPPPPKSEDRIPSEQPAQALAGTAQPPAPPAPPAPPPAPAQAAPAPPQAAADPSGRRFPDLASPRTVDAGMPQVSSAIRNMAEDWVLGKEPKGAELPSNKRLRDEVLTAVRAQKDQIERQLDGIQGRNYDNLQGPAREKAVHDQIAAISPRLAAQVSDWVHGRYIPTARMMTSPGMQRIIALGGKIDPTLTPDTLRTRGAMYRYMTSGQGGRSLVAKATAFDHIDTYMAAVRDVKALQDQAFKRYASIIPQNYRGPAAVSWLNSLVANIPNDPFAQRYQTALANAHNLLVNIAPEIARAQRAGGMATQGGIKEAESGFDINQPMSAIEASAKGTKTLIQQALNQQRAEFLAATGGYGGDLIDWFGNYRKGPNGGTVGQDGPAGAAASYDVARPADVIDAPRPGNPAGYTNDEDGLRKVENWRPDGGTGGAVTVRTPADAQKLAPGTIYTTPDGKRYRR